MSPKRKTAAELRSARWFAPDDLRGSTHRSRFMQMGYGPEDWRGRPVVAVPGNHDIPYTLPARL